MNKEIRIINYVFKVKDIINLISIEQYYNYNDVSAKIKFIYKNEYFEKEIYNVNCESNKIILDDSSISNEILEIKIDREAALEIAKRSRGTPRIANRLLKRVRDYALVLGDGNITLDIAKVALDKLEIDDLGLDGTDKRILETIILKYAGGPVGVETLAATVNEEVETIEDVYEPYLMQIGFLARTPRGRTATPLAYEHLGLEYNN